MNTPVADANAINELLARYGVKFGIYKHGTFKEQLFPFDAIPRVISAEDFSAMERGLVQRVDALNLFLKDIYSDGKIIKDSDWRKLITEQPRRFIAQEVIDFINLPVMENGESVMRKADLRAFVLSGEKTTVWASGLTRFSRKADSFVVNSSQGGGFKDTWVLLPE